MHAETGLIGKHGGYKRLKSFQIAQLCYDVTVRFCDATIERRSRTHDQMVQAARSGVQNIAEGSKASATSRKMEMKLTQVARASLEELRLDYRDFLRHRGWPEWPRDDPRRTALVARRCSTADEVAAWVKETALKERGEGGIGRNGRNGPDGLDGPDGQTTSDAAPQTPPQSGESIQSIQSIPSIQSIKSISSIKSIYPAISANAMLVLIGVACALLDRQVAAQAAAFTRDGGFTERLYRVRTAARRQQGRPPGG